MPDAQTAPQTDASNEELLAIKRLFERDYPQGHNIILTDDRLPEFPNTPTVMALTGSETALHIVLFFRSYEDCIFDVQSGIHKIRELTGNYLWVALPLDSFYEGEKNYNNIMEKTCKDRGHGIIALQQKGLGLSAKVLLDAHHHPQKVLSRYPRLHQEWQKLVDEKEIVEGFAVVEYYERE